MELTICLIVKNESAVLGRCLNCVKQIADEIIVVDTGSTDDSVKIAKQYTDKIYFFKWQNDFAKARNFSFSKATKPYIMWIDADDIITRKNIKKIQELKKNLHKNDVFMLKYCIFSKKTHKNIISFYRERIVKNCKLAKWEGFIHEIIAPFGNVKYLDIEIEHHKEIENKKNRNLKIYNYHLKNGYVLNSREQYYYSKELFYNSYYKKCIKELKKYLRKNDLYYPNVIDAYITLSSCYLVCKDFIKANDCLFDCLKNYMPTSEFLCKIAEIQMLFNRTEKAIMFYESALSLSPNYKSGCFVNEDFNSIIPSLNLTKLYYQIGNYEKAKNYHLLSKKFDKQNPYVKYNEQFFTEKHSVL